MADRTRSGEMAVTEDQLRRIESDLDLAIPSAFRAFLLEFPDEITHPDALDGDDWEWMQSDHGMFHTARSFIEFTRFTRGFGDYDFPHQLLVVGSNGADMLCVNVGESGQTIHFFDHELGELVPSKSRSIQEHVELWTDEAL